MYVRLALQELYFLNSLRDYTKEETPRVDIDFHLKTNDNFVFTRKHDKKHKKSLPRANSPHGNIDFV